MTGPRQGPGRKKAEGFSRQRGGHRRQEWVSKSRGASLGRCARPKARVLVESREPLAGAKESSFYLKLGVEGGDPGSQAKESLPHR